MNAIKKKRRLKRTLKVLNKNKLENDWIRLCRKRGWFD
jgi:hypothetical protein